MMYCFMMSNNEPNKRKELLEAVHMREAIKLFNTDDVKVSKRIVHTLEGKFTSYDYSPA